MIINTALSTVRLVLKQITPDDLAEEGKAAMDACFTGFTEPLSSDDDYVRQGQELAARRFGTAGVPIESDLSTARRFAGDRSLSRGRYFTLCEDSSGNDGGTLVRELGAYHNPQKSGLVTIIDPTLPEHQDRVPLALRGQPLRELLLLFPPVGGASHPFAKRFTSEARPLYMTLPIRVFETEIDGVIDLRQPAVANWFAAALSSLNWSAFQPDLGGTPCPAFPFKQPLESFGDLLPALLCQSIGGGRGAAQIAGLWLRKLGVNGLIFPSARSDSQVLVRDGEVVKWSGFNFVDYRKSPPPETFAAIDFSVDWPKKIQTWPDDYTENAQPIVYDTVAVDYKNQGADKGSWIVQGLEMRRSAPYCFLELAWLLEQLFAPDDLHVKNILGLTYDFLQKMWRPDLSRDFVNALMGMSAPRERILSFIAGPALDPHPEIRESVRIILRQAEVKS